MPIAVVVENDRVPPPLPAASTRQLKLLLADEPPRPSVTVTLTLLVPAVVGVPEITPVVRFKANTAGRPVAVKLNGSPSGSLAWRDSVAGLPTVLIWFPGAFNTGGRLLGVELPFVCTVSAKPPARLPTSPPASSTIYKRQAPFGTLPLKAARSPL
jgi:hypothetical protein